MANPCENGTYLTYTPASSEDGLTGGNLASQFANYPFYLSLGLTCDQIRPDFDANIPGWTSGFYLKNGNEFAKPTVGNIIFTPQPTIDVPVSGPNLSMPDGFSVAVTELRSDGNIDRGTLDIGYYVTAINCDPVDGLTATFEQVITDNLTGAWPIVIGDGNTTGISIGINNYNGPVSPFIGVQTCNGEDTLFQTSQPGARNWAPGIPTYPVSGYEVVSGIINPDDLFCCVTEGQCCDAPPVGSATGFLIPRPENPAPVEENISTPLLNTALYLSNHTYQFTANYGRVPK